MITDVEQLLLNKPYCRCSYKSNKTHTKFDYRFYIALEDVSSIVENHIDLCVITKDNKSFFCSKIEIIFNKKKKRGIALSPASQEGS